MKRGIAFLLRWQVAAAGIQVAAVAAGGVVGWQLLHPTAPGGALTIKHTLAPAGPFPVGLPVTAATAVPRGNAGAARPTLADVMGRVNRDDYRLYRGQWATIQVVATSTRDYLVRHVVPLLLAAAGGERR